jgi:hypothetical protein
MKIIALLKQFDINIFVYFILIASLNIYSMNKEEERSNITINSLCKKIDQKNQFQIIEQLITKQLRTKQSELIKTIQEKNIKDGKEKLKWSCGIGGVFGIGIFALFKLKNIFNCDTKLAKNTTSFLSGILGGAILSQLPRLFPSDKDITKLEGNQKKAIPLFNTSGIFDQFEKEKKSSTDYWLMCSRLTQSFMQSSEKIKEDLIEDSSEEYISWLTDLEKITDDNLKVLGEDAINKIKGIFKVEERNDITDETRDEIGTILRKKLSDNFENYKNGIITEKRKIIERENSWWKLWEPAKYKKAELGEIFQLPCFSEEDTESKEDKENKKDDNQKEPKQRIGNFLSNFEKNQYTISFIENKNETNKKILEKNVRYSLFNCTEEESYQIIAGLSFTEDNTSIGLKILSQNDSDNDKKAGFDQHTTYREFQKLKEIYLTTKELNNKKNELEKRIHYLSGLKESEETIDKLIKTLREIKTLKNYNDFAKGILPKIEAAEKNLKEEEIRAINDAREQVEASIRNNIIE